MSTSQIRYVVAMGLTLAVAACSIASDSLGPDERLDAQLKVLKVLATAPPLAASSVSFYAVKGRDTGADIWYRPRSGQRDSTKFLEFRLAGAALDRRPDGSVIATGDSVRITVTVTDPLRLLVQFQPSGLKFSSKDPARLRMFYKESGEDLDGDGRVDSQDEEIERNLSVWRQELPGLPWAKLASSVVKESKRVDADLSGFTGYALAY